MGQRYRKACLKSMRYCYGSIHLNSMQEQGLNGGLEARGGVEPPIKVLQTFALPLGDRASGVSILPDRKPYSTPCYKINLITSCLKAR